MAIGKATNNEKNELQSSQSGLTLLRHLDSTDLNSTVSPTVHFSIPRDGHGGNDVPETPSIAAADALNGIQKESSVFDQTKYVEMPRFDFGEFTLGPLLGEGSFSNVFEIKCIQVELDNTNSQNDSQSDTNFESKQFISSHCRREGSGDSRYAIKYLKSKSTENNSLFKQGAIDLTTEAALLSSLEHPNIVKIRGFSSNGVSGFEKQPVGGFFIVFDRLYDTLTQRIVRWRPSRRSNIMKDILTRPVVCNDTSMARQESLALRLKVAFDLAQALNYLHDLRILYRDIKPDNIGFDVRGDVKLFDFGMAYEFPSHMDLDSVHALTGCAGTPRYMAPEVANCKPYNLMADVYSFGILLWQIISMKTPFATHSSFSSFFKEVVVEGKRPKLKKSWSTELRQLLVSCWSPKISDRPSFHMVIKVLQKEIMYLRRGDASGLHSAHFRRRSSTFRY